MPRLPGVLTALLIVLVILAILWLVGVRFDVAVR